MRFKTFALIVMTSSMCRAAAPVQQTGDRRTFAVPAAAPAVPEMRYDLKIAASRRQAGDAAALYLEAILLYQKLNQADNFKFVNQIFDQRQEGTLIGKDPRLLDVLKRAGSVFDLITQASEREHCDWNDTPGVWRFVHLNEMRSLANLISVRGKVQIESGNFDDAVHQVQILNAMAGHVASGGPLISWLVGVGIAKLGDSLVADMMARSDCPNLYWPLINRTVPLLSPRDAMEGERRWLLAQMPILAKGNTGGITADDWTVLVKQFIAMQGAMPGTNTANVMATQLILGMASKQDAIKFYASQHHVTQEQIAKLDTPLVLATYFIEQYQITADEQAKLWGLPLHQTIERSAKLSERLNGLEIHSSKLFLSLIPALKEVPVTFGREQRTVAALATIEALRAWAADHGNQLPASLEEIKETPPPVNPMTGKLFDYRIENGMATVSDETSQESDPKHGFPLVYMLKIVHS